MCSNFFFAKAKRFYFSKIFGPKPKLFDVFQLFLAKAKRYYIIQKILDLKENVLVR
jgi:hypothetical protein